MKPASTKGCYTGEEAEDDECHRQSQGHRQAISEKSSTPSLKIFCRRNLKNLDVPCSEKAGSHNREGG
jgi:hypothetical protein